MPPRTLRSPLSIVILGLLAEQPLHPYAMRVLMRERGHDRIVKKGAASLYDTVARLANAGLIAVQETSRQGSRPERTVYEITALGGSSLQDWLREALGDPERAQQFTAALSFMYALGRLEAIALLQERAATLGALVETADGALQAALDAGVPEIFLSEERYGQVLRRAERDWLAEFTERLRSGELSWPTPRPR